MPCFLGIVMLKGLRLSFFYTLPRWQPLAGKTLRHFLPGGRLAYQKYVNEKKKVCK